ncbi:GH25 family lysozyme [Sinomonas mesophila]|uniref:GH25 family lysozyme n=1 Tax=Sinomonas mesophila TaxID=1531955 RepID=UPI000985C3DD|nr:GH25 family lysozyme [Sinomonas mesophila]
MTLLNHIRRRTDGTRNPIAWIAASALLALSAPLLTAVSPGPGAGDGGISSPASPAPIAPSAAPAAPVNLPAEPGDDAALNEAMRLAVGRGAKMGQANPKAIVSQAFGPARGKAVHVPLFGSWQPGWGIAGLDVSAWQAIESPAGSNQYADAVDWRAQWNMGARFAYVKASEGNYYTNQAFGQQYDNSRRVGMIRGAYHFAIPNWSSAADQAHYFVANGGGWSPDGVTLPPVLDIEYNPYAGRTISGVYMGDTCYGMAGSRMTAWIAEFSNTVLNLTGRNPVIYTTTDWWTRCTGNSGAFGANPLWIAAYNESGPGTLPAGWDTFSMWQYSSTGPFAGDSNTWNGDYSSLQRFATYGERNPSWSIGRVAADNSSALGGPMGGITCGLIDGGCYQNFERGAVLWSPATGGHPSFAGPLRDAYKASGFEGGPLRYPVSTQVCGLKDGGCYQNFQRGAIVWSPASGAQISPNGPIRDAWKASGFETGVLAYPTSGVVTGLVNGGSYQNFQRGAIIWSPATGAQTSPNGPIRDAWKASGFETGILAYPTSGVVTGLVNGGSYQNFQNGAIIWSPASGAQASPNGPIRDAWKASGFETGILAYPTSGVVTGLANGGSYQNFQNGAVISSTAGTFISPTGPIRTAWLTSGAERGPLGYPTSGVVTGLANGGSYQNFQNGAVISSTAGTFISPTGPIRAAWLTSGAERGPLGYPTSGVVCGLRESGCYQNFQGGAIVSSPAGTFVSPSGPIRTAWLTSGAENGPLAYPTSGVVTGLINGGAYQNFQKGAIVWSPSTGAQLSPNGPIRTAWLASGAEGGRYGYPISGHTCNSTQTSCSQAFQGGILTWTSNGGVS